MESELNKEIAENIVDKIHSRGWNIYSGIGWTEKGDEGLIEKGPVNEIEYGKPYMILPMTREPKKADDMSKTDMIKTSLLLLATDARYDQTSTSIFRDRPYIFIEGGKKTVFFGFKPYSLGVGIFPGPKNAEILVNFFEFFESLDTLVENKFISTEDVWKSEEW